MKNNSLVQEWIDRANDDWLNATSIFRHKDGTPNAVCFLAQQGAEKLLKSLLVSIDKEVPKIHDLIALKNLLIKNGIDTEILQPKLKILTGYYIGTRYPGEHDEYDWNNAEQAIKDLETVREFVQNKLK